MGEDGYAMTHMYVVISMEESLKAMSSGKAVITKSPLLTQQIII